MRKMKTLNAGIVLVLVFAMVAAPLLAQQATNDYLQGKQDGERDAQGNGNWFFAGCLGLVGVLIAYVVEPSVPTEQLMGKSPEYVRGYEEGYKRKTKSKNATKAVYGCLTLGCVEVVLYSVFIASANTSANTY